MNSNETAPRLSVARLSRTEPTAFRIAPDKTGIAALTAEFGLLDLRKVRFEGRIQAEGRSDWRLEGMLGATAVQPCSVTLAPVTTRIDHPVRRLYQASYRAPSEAEAEMPEDDSIEPLPAVIDLTSLLNEELSLALPDYPRADGAELAPGAFADGENPEPEDEAAKPFAGLAALRKALED